MLPAVAREAVRAHLESRPPDLPRATGELARRAPVFVTVRASGALRGCMGGLAARFADLVAETADRAVVAATEDPRFEPVRLDDLPDCTFEVTILEPLEVATRDDLDPRVYGVEVDDGAGRRGVLLPDIEGVDTVERQLEIVRNKAGIPTGAKVRIRRFRVTKVG